jgi:hypothetical protein
VKRAVAVSEGPIAVGGNLTIGGGYNVAIHSAGSYTVGSDPVPSSLVIGGNVDWAGSAANGQVKIALAAGQTNVLTISASDLSQIKVLTFLNQPAQDTPLLINVTGTGSFDWASPNMAGVSGTQAPYILWNLPGFTTLVRTGGDSLEGTLYAPNADFTDNGATNIEGDIIVKTLRQDVGLSNPTTSEYHYFPFNAELSCGNSTPTPTPTPTISPEGSPTATPSPSPTVTPTGPATPSSAPSPTPGPQPSPVVSPSRPSTPGQLPVTGSDLLVLLGGGVAFIGLGLSTLLLRTRRRL